MEFPDLSNLTATAILGWYAWYAADRVIPALIRDFRTELARQRAERESDRAAWREELATERNQRHNDNVAIVTALEFVAERLAESK